MFRGIDKIKPVPYPFCLSRFKSSHIMSPCILPYLSLGFSKNSEIIPQSIHGMTLGSLWSLKSVVKEFYRSVLRAHWVFLSLTRTENCPVCPFPNDKVRGSSWEIKCTEIYFFLNN